MYTIEEFDKGKTKILKYILYKKRSENEVRRKFEKELDELIELAFKRERQKESTTYSYDVNILAMSGSGKLGTKGSKKA